MIHLEFDHKTVLLHETLQSLGDITGKTVVDCTLGGGGHTALLLHGVGRNGRVVAFDRDEDAIDHAKVKFASEIIHGNLLLVDQPFSQLKRTLIELGIYGNLGGLIADIGVSSHQINLPYRGFSFSMEGPLDMRMDPRTGFPASHFLNNAEESDIANVLWSLGEEQKSRQIARKIVLSRTAKPFQTTSDLSKLISSARLWPGNSKKNPATKTFQALRIHVNDELGELNTLVDDGFGCLEVGAVMTIISFHSLEDRIVKTKFQSLCGKSKRAALPKGIPFTEEQIATLIDQKAIIVGPFPGTPSADEILANPRSRSAKLRSIQKTTK